jgi:cobalamin transport system substrate-binding protein
MAPKWLRTLLAVTALAMIAAGCGDDDGDDAAETPESGESPEDSEATFPVSIAAANGEVTIEQRPERIVSMSASSTEILFAIGAGDQVVAVDSTSTYPDDAPITDLSAFEPNAEAVANYEPDLVVLSDDINDLVASLDALQIPVIHHLAAETLDDTYTQIEQLGAATGHVGEAAELVGRMQSDIDELVASVPEFDEAPTYYHELEETLFSVTSQTFIGELYAMAGLENIADAAADAASLYPQLSDEYIISADPDLIFLADTRCCGVTAETVAQRPGWDQLTAVQSYGVVELDDDVASRWGPRVVEFMAAITESVIALEPASD